MRTLSQEERGDLAEWARAHNGEYPATAARILAALEECSYLTVERDELRDEALRLRSLVSWMLEHNGRHEGALVDFFVKETGEWQALRFIVCTVGKNEIKVGREILKGLEEYGFKRDGEPVMIGTERGKKIPSEQPK
jgi:hypothetical protein